ncbi:MAG TPA: hypothetical protein VER79_07905, partial [Candidatus Limnocylindrales bacterium]|nr:hypothetical protein [Candidatus Limnocylindrales bacterium]
TVGLAAHSGQVDVRITAKAPSLAEADALIAEAESTLRARIGEHVFGVDSNTLDEALAASLRSAGAELSMLEAGVAPVLSERADLLHSRGIRVHMEQAADYSRLRASLKLATDAPLREVAEAAARQLATANDRTVAIAAISTADDSGDEADSTERTALAVCFRGQLRSRSYGFGGRADEVRQFLVSWAWAMAWRLLREPAQ